MLIYLARRFISLGFVLLAVSMIVFTLMHSATCVNFAQDVPRGFGKLLLGVAESEVNVGSRNRE